MRDAILNRVSTRTFNKQELSGKDIQKIEAILEEYKSVKGPFDHVFKFNFRLNDSKSPESRKVGTYGVLRHVPGFIGGICENEFKSLVDYGYIFERVILKLTKEEYDTCWIGGTFKRKDFEKKLKENEIIPAISPVGFRALKRTMIERFVRNSAESDNRKIFDEMFKDYNTLEPLNDTFENPIMQCLDLVRKGPSASNKQPWRAYLDNDIVHFYLKRTQRYPSDSFPYDIQALDIGIAISNFTVGLEYFDFEYTYFHNDKANKIDFNDYVISIKIKK